MAKPDKKLSKAAKAAPTSFAPEATAPVAPKEDNTAPSAKTDIKAALHMEIYGMLKRGEYMPGYSIVPASKAETNGTVETFLLQVGEDALCKMKPGIENLYMTSTDKYKHNVVTGEEAKQIEQTGLNRP